MISKSSPEWPGTKRKLQADIAKQHLQLEGHSSNERLYRAQGRIQALRQFIQDVEDPAPEPPTPE